MSSQIGPGVKRAHGNYLGSRTFPVKMRNCRPGKAMAGMPPSSPQESWDSNLSQLTLSRLPGSSCWHCSAVHTVGTKMLCACVLCREHSGRLLLSKWEGDVCFYCKRVCLMLCIRIQKTNQYQEATTFLTCKEAEFPEPSSFNSL